MNTLGKIFFFPNKQLKTLGTYILTFHSPGQYDNTEAVYILLAKKLYLIFINASIKISSLCSYFL